MHYYAKREIDCCASSSRPVR